ncbi:cell wall hydrolase [Sphingomonas sp.]|uniref:cell wall hydrolase n=1 Tax=Sphingomonas sp. TaxID=28214 RepID=UPI001828D9EA|nr:cell wall hydrolase [Sphingomonas sp.]MBA3511972.1 cell wall hydrolase [Sphingomonas sp.]
MTCLVIARGRLARRFSQLRVEAIGFAVVMLAGLAIGLVGFLAPAGAADDSVSIQLTPAKAAALVAATSASPAENRAVGDEAKLINAALPFSTAPVQAARPFEIAGDDLDHRRALLCLTQAVYYEAGFEPMPGRRAVAQVVLNRMRHPAFPKSVCGVVYQGSRSPVCQFSFVCDGSLYRAPATGAWRDAKLIAEAALAGHVEKPVGAATHYHANYVAPRWAPMLTKITQLGAHIFYRWPGAWGQRAAFTGRYVGEPQDPLALRPPLRSPVLAGSTEQLATIAETAVEAGPAVARAANDVGGLLDVSKGWTLTIPAPDEIGAATAKALADQRAREAAPAVPVASSAAPVIASR